MKEQKVAKCERQQNGKWIIINALIWAMLMLVGSFILTQLNVEDGVSWTYINFLIAGWFIFHDKLSRKSAS